jgi:hypothetical protein
MSAKTMANSQQIFPRYSDIDSVWESNRENDHAATIRARWEDGHPAQNFTMRHYDKMTASNPNYISCPDPVRAMNSRRAEMDALCHERNVKGYPPQTGKAKVDETFKHDPSYYGRFPSARAQGRKHHEAVDIPEFSNLPVSVKGLPWESMGKVRDENGYRKAETLSAKADAFGLYGRKQMIAGQIPNVSNAKLLFADCTDKSKSFNTSPRSLGMMSEWEKKIVTTQGRQSENKLVDRDAVFVMDPFRGTKKGTGDCLWKVEAVQRIKKHGVTYGHGHGPEAPTSTRQPLSSSRSETRVSFGSLGSSRFADSGRNVLSTGTLPAAADNGKDAKIMELRRQIQTMKQGF